MFTKLEVVLFKPRLIGLLIKEKMLYSILMLLLAVVITMSPEIVRISVRDGVSSNLKQEIKYVVNNSSIKDVSINDGILSYTETSSLELSIFTIVLGDVKSVDTNFKYILNFSDNKIDFYASGISIYNISYNELNIDNLKLDSMSYDIKEMSKFINIFDELYNMNKTSLVIYNTLYIFIDIVFMLFTASLFLAALATIITKSNLPFRFKFKIALNCQYVFLLFLLLSVLYNALFLQIIGNLLMAFYTMFATNAVTFKIGRIE